nr:unnamed protein product [Callosobruchus analis]
MRKHCKQNKVNLTSSRL